MTRSYTNRHGESVEVDSYHLDIAIQIKNELQKASPSGRASWVKHKRMMESEGFEDSENSESYRQMIKSEMMARGVLPSSKQHTELFIENKIQAIKNEIGEIRESKLEAQVEFTKLNRLKRELSKDIVLIEGIERALKNKDFNSPPEFKPVFQSSIPGKYMIACISDLHYGAIVDVEGRKYDTDIAEKLLMEYAEKVLEIADDNNVEEVFVVNLGDVIEGVYMRTQNAYSAEKTFSEQVADVSEIVIKFLQRLSTSVNVKYAGINGNHDRVSSKNDNLYSDGAVGMSNKIIETFIRYAGNNRISYVNSEPYHHIVETNGRKFLFVHGDKTPLKKNSVLAEQSTLYNIQFDALIGGHIHHYTVNEVSEDKYVVTFGSIKGNDEYSLKTIGSSSSRSQGVILVAEDGNYEIKQVKL